MFQMERGTKLLFSVSEAYSSLVTKNYRGLERERKHLHSVVTRKDLNTHTVPVSMADTDKGNEDIDFLMLCDMCEWYELNCLSWYNHMEIFFLADPAN